MEICQTEQEQYLKKIFWQQICAFWCLFSFTLVDHPVSTCKSLLKQSSKSSDNSKLQETGADCAGLWRTVATLGTSFEANPMPS